MFTSLKLHTSFTAYLYGKYVIVYLPLGYIAVCLSLGLIKSGALLVPCALESHNTLFTDHV